MTQDRTTELGKRLFYASYVLMLVRTLLISSTAGVLLGTDTIFFRYVFRILAWMPIVFKLFTQDRFSRTALLRYLLFGGVAVLSFLFNRHTVLADLVLLILGVHGVPFKGAVGAFLYTAGSVCVLLFLLSILGLIENYVTYSAGKARYAFGNVYATDFAATVFYLQLAHAYLKGKKYNLLNFLFWICVSFFILIFCVARLDFILIFCTAWAMLLFAYVPKFFSSRPVRGFLWLSIPILCVLSIVLHILYTPQSGFLTWLNGLISGRLYYGNIAIKDYGFTLFGQNIEMQGWGFNPDAWDRELGYYFVDCGWLSLALQYGIVTVCFVCAAFTVLSRRAAKEGGVLPLVLFFLALTSVIDHHLFEFWFDPFLLLLNAVLCGKKRQSAAVRPALAATV